MPTLTVAGTNVTVRTRPGEPILKALSRSGYAHTSGCRRGGCGICKVDLVSGAVDYPVSVAAEVLSADERRAGRCLTCRAVPTADTVIQLAETDKLRCVAPFLAAVARFSTH